MTASKRKKKEDSTFFLYVFFHSVFSGIANMFSEDT